MTARIVGLFILIIIVFMMSCSEAVNSPSNKLDIPIESTNATPTQSNITSATDVKVAYPFYLPAPYFYVFRNLSDVSLEDNSALEAWRLDSFLHNTSVSFYSNRVNPKEGSLLLPSLRLLDSWDCEDGAEYFLCLEARIDYYGLAKTIIAGEKYVDPFDTTNGYTGLGSLIRIKAKYVGDTSESGYTAYGFDLNNGYQCMEYLETPPWGDNGDAIKSMAAERSELCQMLLDVYSNSGTASESLENIPFVRDILPDAHDKYKLLEKYLEYYTLDGKGVMTKSWPHN